MKTKTKTLVNALQILARDIESTDGVANAAIFEASERLEELEREKAELVAQVVAINAAIDKWESSASMWDMTTAFNGIKSTRKLSPTQCLNQIKAEAVRDAVKLFYPSRDIDAEALESYAASIVKVE